LVSGSALGAVTPYSGTDITKYSEARGSSPLKTNNAMTRQIKFGLFGVGAALSLLHMQGAVAETTNPTSLDYVEIFKTKVFPCIHPTVKTDTVKVELAKEAATAGDITTARVQAFYQGLINKNSMQVDIMVRQSGSIRQLKANVLSDTSSIHGSCELVKDWKDF
jgi:hypothetical protein